ncbi:FOG1 protein [Lachancea thermotolerans]
MGNTHSKRAMSENMKDVSMVDVSSAEDEDKKGSQRAIVQSFSKLDIGDHSSSGAPLMRRRSTLIFDDEDESPRHEENVGDQADLNEFGGPSSESSSSASVFHQRQQQTPPAQESEPPAAEAPRVMVPVEITWQQGGSKVYVTGSFTGWRKMIGLVPVADQPGVFHIKLQLPPGTHRFRFIVDNELRFSDYLATATDQMGNFVNYLEISPQDSQQQLQLQQQQQQQQQQLQPLQQPQQPQPQEQPQHPANYPPRSRRAEAAAEPLSARSKLALQIEEEPDDMGDGYSRFHGGAEATPAYSYTTDIPAVFTDSSVMEQYYLTLDQQQNNQQSMAWLTPPQLPPHLENVILNNYSNSSDPGGSGSENNSGALPIPNHVVLNHLATSSIKHNTLCVASIVRYKCKYATQILYSPLQ